MVVAWVVAAVDVEACVVVAIVLVDPVPTLAKFLVENGPRRRIGLPPLKVVPCLILPLNRNSLPATAGIELSP